MVLEISQGLPHPLLMISLSHSIKNKTESLGPEDGSCPEDIGAERPSPGTDQWRRWPRWRSAGAAGWEKLAFAQMALPAASRVPSTLSACFPGRLRREVWGECASSLCPERDWFFLWALSLETRKGASPPTADTRRTGHVFQNPWGLGSSLSSAACQGVAFALRLFLCHDEIR